MLINNLIPSFVRIIKCIHCLRKMRLYMTIENVKKQLNIKFLRFAIFSIIFVSRLLKLKNVLEFY